MGVETLREVREEKMGGRIPKVWQLGEIRKNSQHCTIFHNLNSTQTRGPLQKKARTAKCKLQEEFENGLDLEIKTV